MMNIKKGNIVKRVLLGWLILSISPCSAVTVADVQKLKVTTFFGEWSKFLDQVLQAQQDPISSENENTYQTFIQQAKKLNIPKATGNKESITAMEEQMKAIQKRMGDEKKISEEWKQFSESVMNAQQPISVENQEAYKELIKRAKDVGIGKAQIDAMEAKMKEAKDKFGLAASLPPTPPAPIIPSSASVPAQEIVPAPPAPTPEIKK